MAEASQRHAWAAETLSVDPGERLLEVGCGHGVTASLVCDRLEQGKLTAIDRSAKMIAAASDRNREHIETGRARFETATLADATLDPGSFEKLFAINVAHFWRDPQQALGRARELLAADGSIHLFWQPPGWRDAAQARGFAEQIAEALRGQDFAIEELVVAELEPVAGVCVVGSPA